MASASISSFFFNRYYYCFISLFLLAIHLGCFNFTSNKGLHNRTNLPPQQQQQQLRTNNINNNTNNKKKKRKSHHHRAALSSSWSFVKRIVSSSPYYYYRSSKSCKPANNTSSPAAPTLSSPKSAQHSSLASPPETANHWSLRKRPDPDIFMMRNNNNYNPFSPLRINDIYPCPTCGEIFQKQVLLEHHQTVKHAVTELFDDGDSGKNIVHIIFQTGWNPKAKNPPSVMISRILKIHNSPKTLTRFEEYRETVKAKAARSGVIKGIINERCLADGNELLRFHCTTFLCDLGKNGNSSSLCSLQYCSLCGIIRSGFSPKMDGISTLCSSWRAHVAIPEDIEEEFGFMNVKRAMLVCRVVAGRVGCDPDDEVVVVEKDGGGYDSVVGRGTGNGIFTRADEDELLVFNPRAVLPCFVIVYTTTTTTSV